MAVTYRSSGVDIASADGWLARMAPLIRSTRRPEVLPDRGQFAGWFRLAARRYRDPVLVASTDGVGTKLQVARLVGRHEGIGIDVVAMNVNDVVTCGAEPLFFLDYLAIGRLEPPVMGALLRGIVRGCRESGCALLGGETAEMPGVYGSGAYEVAGFCVGVVDRRTLIDGSRVRAGDRIVGLASSGVHANGFSLIRQVFTPSQLRGLSRHLLTPTRLYVKAVLRALAALPLHAITHVTGGGLSRRIPALVAGSRGLRARVHEGSWPVPAIFDRIQKAGGIAPEEMAATFNMGIGMAVACRPGDARRLVRLMQHAGIPAWDIGVMERER